SHHQKGKAEIVVTMNRQLESSTKEPRNASLKGLGVRQTEISYAITSVDRERANARDLLKFVRGHWGIENRLHWVRDVVMGEEKCRARTGGIPKISQPFKVPR
ncbi:transposase, partial [Rosistilla oblonga]|uniref:transposase n=1 Tax=Rosistilla oblonga TaxID=2527990 RepID=UPI003A978AF8